jgi:hypothetical protein
MFIRRRRCGHRWREGRRPEARSKRRGCAGPIRKCVYLRHVFGRIASLPTNRVHEIFAVERSLAIGRDTISHPPKKRDRQQDEPPSWPYGYEKSIIPAVALDIGQCRLRYRAELMPARRG